MTTKEELAQEWVEALESGNYQQGEGYLCRYGRYCCLGVVSELAVEQGLIQKDTGEGVVHYDHSDVILPIPLMELLDISRVGHFRNEDGHIRTLAEENDSGASFEEIADIIRRGFDPKDESIQFLARDAA